MASTVVAEIPVEPPATPVGVLVKENIGEVKTAEPLLTLSVGTELDNMGASLPTPTSQTESSPSSDEEPSSQLTPLAAVAQAVAEGMVSFTPLLAAPLAPHTDRNFLCSVCNMTSQDNFSYLGRTDADWLSFVRTVFQNTPSFREASLQDLMHQLRTIADLSNINFYFVKRKIIEFCGKKYRKRSKPVMVNGTLETPTEVNEKELKEENKSRDIVKAVVYATIIRYILKTTKCERCFMITEKTFRDKYPFCEDDKYLSDKTESQYLRRCEVAARCGLIDHKIFHPDKDLYRFLGVAPLIQGTDCFTREYTTGGGITKSDGPLVRAARNRLNIFQTLLGRELYFYKPKNRIDGSQPSSTTSSSSTAATLPTASVLESTLVHPTASAALSLPLAIPTQLLSSLPIKEELTNTGRKRKGGKSFDDTTKSLTTTTTTTTTTTVRDDRRKRGARVIASKIEKPLPPLKRSALDPSTVGNFFPSHEQLAMLRQHQHTLQQHQLQAAMQQAQRKGDKEGGNLNPDMECFLFFVKNVNNEPGK